MTSMYVSKQPMHNQHPHEHQCGIGNISLQAKHFVQMVYIQQQ